MKIEILIADNRYLIQETVKAILRDEAEIEIVGTARNGIEAIAFAQQLQPHIILLDIEMPKIDGIEVTKRITNLLPNIKVIILSGHNNPMYSVTL